MDVSAHFSALDDEEFFVVEGSTGGGDAGSLLSCVLPPELGALGMTLDRHGVL